MRKRWALVHPPAPNDPGARGRRTQGAQAPHRLPVARLECLLWVIRGAKFRGRRGRICFDKGLAAQEGSMRKEKYHPSSEAGNGLIDRRRGRAPSQKRWLAISCLAALTMFASPHAPAQVYPVKPVVFIT